MKQALQALVAGTALAIAGEAIQINGGRKRKAYEAPKSKQTRNNRKKNKAARKARKQSRR